jgi:hypothetical protein
LARTRRWAAGAITLLALVAVGAATLTTSSTPVPPAGPWCVICGDLGTIDALQNVVLFLPLGAGLAWLGVAFLPAALGAGAVSLSVELLQYFVVRGRDGTLGDVITNTTGAVLAFQLVRARVNLLAPVGAWSTALAFAGGLGWALVLAASVYGFRPAVPAGDYVLSTEPPYPRMLRFQGELRSTTVDGVTLTPGRVTGQEAVRRLLADRHTLVSADVTPSSPTLRIAVIARLGARANAFSFAQVGRAFSCTWYLGASVLRLQSPSFILPDAFPGARDAREGRTPPHRLACAREGDTVRLARERPDGRLERAVTLTPGLGWAQFLPVRLVLTDPALRLKNAAWLWLIALPGSVWIAAWWRRGKDVPAAVPGLGAALLAIAALALQAGMLVTWGGTALWYEFAATGAGVLTGVALAHLMRRARSHSFRL